jgi:putative sigma-54 modulation protein
MKIEIVGKDYKVSDKLIEIITKKINKLDKYFSEHATVKVYCRTENNTNKMEINIQDKGMFYRAEASSNENMYSNIDLALPKLEKQIIKHKDKLQSKMKTDAFVAPYAFLDKEPEEKESKVVKTKTFDLTPISVEDAELYLDMSDHNFYVFLNEKTMKVNVIYNRNDKDYGLIEVNY